MGRRQYRLVVALALILTLGVSGTVFADQSSSSHYMVNETQFGSGSSVHDCSTNYCAKTSAGDLVVGNSASANYSAQFGANTTDEPLLEIIVIGGNQDMGVLDNTHTGTATATIKVRNYLSDGYSLYMTGAAPSQGTHSLKAMALTGPSACPCTSQPGAEQFGINLADNTSPNIGADPLQVPSSAFSFGQVTDNYKQADLFAYSDGDAVAFSDKSTGETDYTLSMIINVSNVTPGGRYNGAYSAVVSAVF